jgi:large exoprotein involved in heme utilization and adhesion
VRISDSAVNADAQGPIRLSNQAELDVSGNGGGAIRIHGGALRLDNSSIFAFNTGERDSTAGIDLQADLIELDNSPVGLAATGSGRSGAITVRAGTLSMKGPGSAIADNTGAGGDAGTVTVQADRLFSFGSVISSAAASGSTGRGGTVTVMARELELHNGGQIHSGTLGKGDAGRVTVNADHLLVSGFRISGVTEAGYPSGIASSAAIGSTGRAGTVVVTARELTVQNGGQIASNTFGRGNAGTVEVRADRLIASGGTSGFTNLASTAQPGSTGRGGTVAIVAGALELHNGAQIISTTWGPGDAGQITIEADRLLVSGFDPRRGSQYASGIGSSTQPGSTGWGGAVAVTAHDVTVQDGGQIASSTFGSGDAGTVEMRADRLKVYGGNLGFANIASSTSPGSTGRGGAIVVMAGELELRGGAQITSSTQGPGDAGHISIDADRLLVSGAGAKPRPV